jgi:hypothetical protein
MPIGVARRATRAEEIQVPDRVHPVGRGACYADPNEGFCKKGIKIALKIVAGPNATAAHHV